MMMSAKAFLLPAGFVAGLVFEALALSVSVSLPTTGCQTSADSDAGPPGAQTSECLGSGGSGSDQTPCCIAAGSACSGDFECCSGSCSGGTCVTNSANPSCKAELGSRCETGGCQCTTDTDCCIGGCGKNTVGDGDAGDLRCCLSSGTPCGSPYDCCSLNCRSDTAQCE
jgi:hypothetical protein